MTGLVKTVQTRVKKECVVGSISKQGCPVPLKGSPEPRIIVDLDKPGSPIGQDRTRCDYLFFAEISDRIGWIVPLELKKGQLYATDAVRQLRAGACAAERLVPSTMNVKFRPVVAAGGIHRAQWNLLKDKKNRVKFHEILKYVKVLRCNEPLINALDE